MRITLILNLVATATSKFFKVQNPLIVKEKECRTAFSNDKEV